MTCPACAINERLIEIMGNELLRESRELADDGLSREEINRELRHHVPVWERWRADSLPKALRWLDEANAPSLETQSQ